MTSFPKADDEWFLEFLRQMKQAGVRVSLNTLQDADRVVTRTATVSWDTHNAEARAL